ncbi:exocyst complex component sec10 [Perilla frutescens var. hirtella]|uniref:Exocyst complex component sec10 n=1 Tax=Perilla frutescens var. hirtella TaxID=608512 RepID=A0AAD4PBD1_PERFH|nr:exocyst complex component sec10 [Perilla frutescens var. hirtella]
MKFMKLGSKPDTFQTDGNSIRYVASELATDVVVHVGDVMFYLHKFPLLSKSARLQKLVSSANEGNGNEINIDDIPGGASAFEVCAKFCYGMTVTLNAYNVVTTRVAAEYLEMHETVEKGNLIYKVDAFLTSSIFRSWKDSIIVLQTTKSMSPLPEELKLISHCIDAIASKASVDVSKVDWSYTYNRKKIADENGNDPSWNGIRNRTVPSDWWVEDLCELEIDLFKRVIMTIESKEVVSNEVIGEALKAYAYRKLPGSGKNVIQQNDLAKFRNILDTIVWLLPAEKGSVSCSFLFKLLKAAISANSAETVKVELVKRIGHQLEEAYVNDLLIRASEGEETMYDVHVVKKILEEFMTQDEIAETEIENGGEIQEIRRPGILSEASKLMVAKLIDGYLAEIAKDPNLPLSLFTGIAEMVSSCSRPGHDALYRAIDTYLKVHPGISKSDRKRICRLMDCKKLSADACMHAVQNERLPLRVVVQVLFFEQVRASASSGSSTPDLPKAIKDLNCGSYGSSRSATTHTDEDWDAVASAEELRALRGELAALRLGNGVVQDRNGGESKISNSDRDRAAIGKMKGLIMSKRIFSKIWSNKAAQAENSGSDSSESLGSANHDEVKSTPTRKKNAKRAENGKNSRKSLSSKCYTVPTPPSSAVQMKETKDGTKTDSYPIILNLDEFKGDFSFDALFGKLVYQILPSCLEEETDAYEGFGINDAVPHGHMRTHSEAGKFTQVISSPLFPEVDALLSLFKNSGTQLIDLRKQIDGKLYNLKKEVATQDSKHRKTLSELEKGVAGLFDSFARLDSRISSVGQTAAKIGDHLQNADTQRETASQTIDLIKYLMEFNSSPGDLMELSPLFSDDSRVAEAASIAQKLRLFAEEDPGRQSMAVSSVVGNVTASKGLEVAVGNLQEYCNELENKLLSRFDAASQKKDLSSMAECAKILLQFNRGTSVMQHYVGLRPMFDLEVMNSDVQVVLGDPGSQPIPSNTALGLSSLYKEITDTVRKEAATITAVFPFPNDVMSILVQRVLEDRVPNLLEKLLLKPSIANPPAKEEGGLILYLRMLAVAYEKTLELSKDLRNVGCGDLDVEGLTESLFLPHKDTYIEYEKVSLRQLNKAKMEELGIEIQQTSESRGTIGRSRGASIASSQHQMSVTVVADFVHWNEEAISRCTLFSSQQATLAANVRGVFTCLLKQVSQYITDGLERARESLTDAAASRERFVLGTSVGRRVAGATSIGETAAAAGESSFKSFMLALQQCGSSVAIVQQYFAKSISQLLLPVEGAHAAACEEMASAMSSAESAAQKGLQQCIETVMAEVERLQSAEQKATDFRSSDDGIGPDHRPTNACTRVISYLSRVLEAAFNALEGLNKQAFLTELGNRLHKGLMNHWEKFTFNWSGGLQLKRDITDYADFVRNFNAPTVDEKFESMGILANVFIVAPESLSSLFEGTPSIKSDAKRFIQLRDDYKSAKLASKLASLWSS